MFNFTKITKLDFEYTWPYLLLIQLIANKQNYWLIWSIILHFIIEHCWLLTDYPSEKKNCQYIIRWIDIALIFKLHFLYNRFSVWICSIYAIFCIRWMHVLWRIFGGSKRIGVSKCFQVSYFFKVSRDSIFPNSMEK